jgi:putative tricarboxylic transport membrane protein
MAVRMNKILPYAIVLAIVSYLYFLAAKMDFVAPGGRIGPDFWPKVILAMAMVTCAYEIVKNLFFGKADRELEGVLASVLKDAPIEQPIATAEEKTYPRLLWAGIAMTVAYAVLIEKLGFFLCTFIYLGAFTWIGRYRRLGVILVTSLVGSLAFMFMFMKIVYVSLPLGVDPFSQVSFLLMRLMGIK